MSDLLHIVSITLFFSLFLTFGMRYVAIAMAVVSGVMSYMSSSKKKRAQRRLLEARKDLLNREGEAYDALGNKVKDQYYEYGKEHDEMRQEYWNALTDPQRAEMREMDEDTARDIMDSAIEEQYKSRIGGTGEGGGAAVQQFMQGISDKNELAYAPTKDLKALDYALLAQKGRDNEAGRTLNIGGAKLGQESRQFDYETSLEGLELERGFNEERVALGVQEIDAANAGAGYDLASAGLSVISQAYGASEGGKKT